MVRIGGLAVLRLIAPDRLSCRGTIIGTSLLPDGEQSHGEMSRDVPGSGSSMLTGLFAGATVAAFAFGSAVAGPAPELLAQTFVLRGTDIGGVPTDAEYPASWEASSAGSLARKTLFR